jgi:hypothetical protein
VEMKRIFAIEQHAFDEGYHVSCGLMTWTHNSYVDHLQIHTTSLHLHSPLFNFYSWKKKPICFYKYFWIHKHSNILHVLCILPYTVYFLWG